MVMQNTVRRERTWRRRQWVSGGRSMIAGRERRGRLFMPEADPGDSCRYMVIGTLVVQIAGKHGLIIVYRLNITVS